MPTRDELDNLRKFIGELRDNVADYSRIVKSQTKELTSSGESLSQSVAVSLFSYPFITVESLTPYYSSSLAKFDLLP